MLGHFPDYIIADSSFHKDEKFLGQKDTWLHERGMNFEQPDENCKRIHSRACPPRNEQISRYHYQWDRWRQGQVNRDDHPVSLTIRAPFSFSEFSCTWSVLGSGHDEGHPIVGIISSFELSAVQEPVILDFLIEKVVLVLSCAG